MPDQDERDGRPFVAGTVGFEPGDGRADALAGGRFFLEQRPGAIELLPVEAVDGFAAGQVDGVHAHGLALKLAPQPHEPPALELRKRKRTPLPGLEHNTIRKSYITASSRN